MGGGVSPLEWVFPPVAATHLVYNAAAQQVSPNAKIITAGSVTERRRTAEDTQRHADEAERQATRQRLGAAQTARDQEAERARLEGLPSNVRRRAGIAASQLGLTGEKRPSASAYLAGVSA